MSYRNRRAARRSRRRGAAEDINPMNYVSNLSDVMLILAVGIMLSLILHWKVPVGGEAEDAANGQSQETITFSEDDLDEQQELPDDLTQVGDVYYDAETGTYYIIQNSGGAEE